MHRKTVLFAALWVAAAGAAAQPSAYRPADHHPAVVDVGRTRLAVAPDGSSAVAFEALVQLNVTQEWHVGVQRFAPGGAPVGPPHFFRGESCGFVWISNYVERPELAFRPDGILLVLMQHTGDFSIGVDLVPSAEARLGAIAPDGTVLDVNPGSSTCTEKELVFVDGGRQDRPRLALTPTGEAFVTVDGFFGDSAFRNVAVRVLDADLNAVPGLDQIVPHDDPLSQQSYHRDPDVATNGRVVLAAWQECPLIDNQGNAAECDVGVQLARVAGSTLAPLGANLRANAGDPPGTLSVWPSAAVNAAGASVVVWADTRSSAGGDVYAQRFDADGRPVGGNLRISTGAGELFDRPEVAMADDGGFVAVWADRTATSVTARGRAYDAAGRPLGPPFLLSQTPGLHTATPDVVTDGSGYAFSWLGIGSGSLTIHGRPMGSLATAREDEDAPAPAGLTLDAYPNPFSASAAVRFTLAEAAHVTVAVHDLQGREVARLVDGLRPPGVHEAPLDGAAWPSGPYLVRLTAGPHTAARVLVHVR